jgi:hypothetical protein
VQGHQQRFSLLKQPATADLRQQRMVQWMQLLRKLGCWSAAALLPLCRSCACDVCGQIRRHMRVQRLPAPSVHHSSWAPSTAINGPHLMQLRCTCGCQGTLRLLACRQKLRHRC